MVPALFSFAALQRASFRYTPCYCEENVWRLCDDLLQQQGQWQQQLQDVVLDSLDGQSWELSAVFVSNPKRQVAMWCQRAGKGSLTFGMSNFVLWDYHVFAVLETEDRRSYILDLDTTLEPFLLPFIDYAEQALRSEHLADCKDFPKRFFRVVPGREYLQSLCSDRSHMLTAEGTYSISPPSEAPILCTREGCADGRTSNLFSHFVSMDGTTGVGQVFDEPCFLQRFGCPLRTSK
mmetsp:Transcript_91927/g.177035  ORF Transcript_91927/g.177035 Transcript_91927/m.177035 type:complete len:235 (+) Transcript_91927:62-766(+)|eukprot:CAMPEP_0172722684 /NCGR_PEP_ID=MMETSP1074-20121228/82083_1 /TAXON_ID=2916 /ORGANISM="Ceratium fusus, Strain PA161109" /LENGTH=234 /DNA_ID=CAMNT_0013548739 /DNA_START=50 /DNA_END=754 /DNA_ORIENTATION=-